MSSKQNAESGFRVYETRKSFANKSKEETAATTKKNSKNVGKTAKRRKKKTKIKSRSQRNRTVEWKARVKNLRQWKEDGRWRWEGGGRVRTGRSFELT